MDLSRRNGVVLQRPLTKAAQWARQKREVSRWCHGNATNEQAITYTSARPLVVGRAGPIVNNISMVVASQTGLDSENTFTPTWTVKTEKSLIADQLPGGKSGNFSLEASGRNVDSLTAGGNQMINRIIGNKLFWRFIL